MFGPNGITDCLRADAPAEPSGIGDVRPMSKSRHPRICKEFHAARFVPNNTMIAVVGDFKTADVIRRNHSAQQDWKAAPPPKVNVRRSSRCRPSRKKSLPVPMRPLSYLGMRIPAADEAGLMERRTFTDRSVVNARIGGFYYPTSARPADVVGTFTGPLGPIRDKFQPVKDGFLKEIRRIRDEAPTARRSKTQDVPARQPAVPLPSNNAIASTLLQIERFGLGSITRMLPKSSQCGDAGRRPCVARKHLQPDHLAWWRRPSDGHGNPRPRNDLARYEGIMGCLDLATDDGRPSGGGGGVR